MFYGGLNAKQIEEGAGFDPAPPIAGKADYDSASNNVSSHKL